jgi:hypothetical protein
VYRITCLLGLTLTLALGLAFESAALPLHAHGLGSGDESGGGRGSEVGEGNTARNGQQRGRGGAQGKRVGWEDLDASVPAHADHAGNGGHDATMLPMKHGGHDAGDSGLEYSVDGNTLTMQITPKRGKVARVAVTTTSVDGEIRTPLDAGWHEGSGIDIRRMRIGEDGSVTFLFKTSFFGRLVQQGIPTDPFYVEYDLLQDGDLATLCCWARPGGGGPLTVSIVPEPSAGLLIVVGSGLLAMARRR